MASHPGDEGRGLGERAVPDLSPRSEASLEWWFVQGFVEGEQLGHRDFMHSFFRQAGGDRGRDGHMLLSASLGHGEDAHRASSRVSPRLIENFNREAPDEVRGTALDPTIVRAFLEEIASGGPPEPIRTAREGAHITARPLCIEWDGFALDQQDEGIELTFPLPSDGRVCRLSARPKRAWYRGRDVGGGDIGTMAYDSCPRLDLSGWAGEEPVAGTCWIDHQWGDHGWLRAPADRSALVGWEWLGINLDDGRDLMVMVHRDMGTREPVSCFAVFYDGAARPEVIEDAHVTASREWRSPRTMIDYPVACRIEIPALRARLEFAPSVDDQEIPVFGLIDAIWEGAGQVSGTVAGRPASGRARLELHGYAYVPDFATYQKRWVERIDRNISAFLPRTLDRQCLIDFVGEPRWSLDPACQTEMVAEPVWDLISRGGKHWRPVFGYLLLDALGADVRPFERMLSTIPELIHNGSVIVDDIEDASPLRRGEASIHARYGLPTALNAGNTLYFLPLLSIAEHPHLTVEQRDAIYRVIVAMFVRAHLGQAQDLYWSKLDPDAMRCALGDDRTAALVLQAHAFKSAAAVRATAEVACIVADSDAAIRAACTRLAESWGVAFQIVDDVNGFTRSPKWGKERGEDVREGKISYAIHKAVCHLEGDDRARLLEILASPERRRSDAGLSEAVRLIESSGALETCRREAAELVAEDWPAFSAAVRSSRAKFMLRALLETLLGTPVEM